MQVSTELVRLAPIFRFLRSELTLTRTRWRTMVRISVCTTVMVAVAMTFRIPLPAYVAYLVFVVSQEDAASTLMTAVGGVLAISIAVTLSMLFYIVDASEPALRIPLMALSAFLGSFLSRTSSLGPLAFLAGYILVLTQTLLDESHATEPVVHGILWLWVVVSAPVAVTVVMTMLTGESPVSLARKKAALAIEDLSSYLEAPHTQHPARIREQLLALDGLKKKAMLWNKRLKVFAQEDAAVLALLVEILEIARSLPGNTAQALRCRFAVSVRCAGESLLNRRMHADTMGVGAGSSAAEAPAEPAAWAMHLAIGELTERARGHGGKSSAPQKPTARSFFVPDAFTNRAYARFAIKVAIVVMASYATYTLLDWPGIRTAVTTCFFVTLTTFGESMHKFTLRVSGALIGGILGGLCLVFVLPMLTDIGELCVVIALVSMLGAWIATGSETISYAGMQIAFAFFLGVLQGYGPNTDLTELRDRVAGILVGNVWVTVIFATLWPVSAKTEIHRLQSALFQELGRFLRKENTFLTGTEKMDVAQKLGHLALLHARSAFEWRPIDTARRPVATMPTPDLVASRVLTLLRVRATGLDSAVPSQVDVQLARQLDAWPDAQAMRDTAMLDDPRVPEILSQARRQLEEEIAHAMRSV